jgi:hypothetical protein
MGAAAVSLRKPKDEGERWIQYSLVALGLFAAMIVVFAIIPSFFLYFADGTLKWTSKLMAAVRDIVLSGYYVVVLSVVAAAIIRWNKRNPRILPAGEDKREATGGYK